MTGGVLQEIAQYVRQQAAAREAVYPLKQLQADMGQIKREPLSLIAQLRRPGVNIIAEVKRRSPSRPDIALHLDPVTVAGDYLTHKAAAISVLTETKYFGGSLEILAAIRQHYPQACLLLKDFVQTPYQIYEARKFGADAVLLIVALLGLDRARELYQLATGLGLQCLVEVHTAEEVQIANQLKAAIVGINNRDLVSLKIDLATSARLRTLVHPDAVVISESGIGSAQEVNAMRQQGIQGFLIGTSFMQTGKPGPALKMLLDACGRTP